MFNVKSLLPLDCVVFYSYNLNAVVKALLLIGSASNPHKKTFLSDLIDTSVTVCTSKTQPNNQPNN